MTDKTSFEIAKKCYEERYGTQKYDGSVLYKTFGVVIDKIIRQAKKELLEEFKKANPYYYSKIEECKDFQKIMHSLLVSKPKKVVLK